MTRPLALVIQSTRRVLAGLKTVHPLLEKFFVLRGHFVECGAHANVGLRIDYMASGLECLAAMDDLNGYEAFGREGIHHVHVATVAAEFAGASADVHSGVEFGDFGRSKKWMAWRTAKV